MIITREKFVPEFLKWVEVKLKTLPEKDLDGSMLRQALELLDRHKKDLENITWT